MKKRNVELLEKVADKIESQPELWRQDLFRQELDCGTAYCIGGWAAALSGLDRVLPQQMADLLGLDFVDAMFIFYGGFSHTTEEWAHKETAEWLREIARGGDVEETAPSWWDDEVDE